jgi:hypothetical protein
MGTEVVVKVVPSAASRAIRVPSVFQCGMKVFLVKMALAIRGFGWTIRWIRQRVEAVSDISSVSLEAVKATEYSVALAGALYPGRARCLEQSLVLYYLLRRQGVAVKYRQGIQSHPFESHAWIEYGGEPLNDAVEHAALFARLPDQLP